MTTFLQRLIRFAENPKPRKPRLKIIKPYLAGTTYGESKQGAALAAAVHVQRRSPIREEIVKNTGIDERPRIVATDVIQQDPADPKKKWFVDRDPEKGDIIREAKPTDLVRPTNSYAKVRTRGEVIKHQPELYKAMAESSRTEAGRDAAKQKFMREQRRRSGEDSRFIDRPHIRKVHEEEMSNIRSRIAQDVLEGRAIVRKSNKNTGHKLEKSNIPDFVRSTRKSLDDMVEVHVRNKQAERDKLLGDIHKEVSEKIRQRHIEGGNVEPVKPEHYRKDLLEKVQKAHIQTGRTEPDAGYVYKVTSAHTAILHEPVEHTLEPARHYGHLADLMGKTPEDIQQLHKQISDLGAAGSEGSRAIKRQELIRSGEIFHPAEVASAYAQIHGKIKPPGLKTTLTEFPKLKAARIAAGAIGVLGAGIAIGRGIKKKREPVQQMSSRLRIINFAKKIPKVPKINLTGLPNVSKAPDLPRALIQKPPWEAVEHHAIQNVDVLQSQIAKRKKEALGQIYETHTPEGLKSIKAVGKKEQRQVNDLTKSYRAIEGAKYGIGKGRAIRTEEGWIHQQIEEPKKGIGTIAQRALGGRIGIEPSTLPPGKKRDFNIDIAAAGKDSKTYNAHRKWMAQKGEPIGTMAQRRKALAGKIKGWRAEAKATAVFDRATTGLRERTAQAERTIGKQSEYIDTMREHGKDATHLIETAKSEGIREADSQAIRDLRGAKTYWERQIKEKVGKVENEHAAATRKLKGSINKRVAIGAGAGATAGGVAGYEGGKRKKKEVQFSDPSQIQRARNRIRPSQNTKIHDAVTGGIEGGVGIFATDPLYRRLTGESPTIARALKDSLHGGPRKLIKKAGVGAVIGAAATGLVGAAVSGYAKRRRDREPVFSAVDKVIYFVETPTPPRTAVTRDRYSKKIRTEDLTRAERNYVRTAIGGAAISSLLRKRTGLALKPALAAGAVTGIAAQALLRHQTAKTKDQFGDRPYEARRADNALGQASLIGAGTLAAHQVVRSTKPYRDAVGKVGRGLKRVARFAGILKMSNRDRIIRFDDALDEQEIAKKYERQKRKTARAIENSGVYVRRGGRLVRDIRATIKGESVLDARGREKTKEWDRPWVRNAASVAIVGGTAAGIAGVKKTAETASEQSEVGEFVRHVQSGALKKAAGTAMYKHVPGAAKVTEAFRKNRAEFADEIASAAEKTSLLGKVNKGIKKYAGMERKRKYEDVPAKDGGTTRYHEGSKGYAKIQKRNMSGVEKAASTAERSAVSEIEKAARSRAPLKITDWIKRIKKLSARGNVIRLAEPPGQYEDDWEDWLRSRPGVTKRNRRNKTIFEKDENKKVINRAKIGAALVLGTALGTTFRPGSGPQPIRKKLQQVAKNFQDLTPIIELNALGDRLIKCL